jgi:hypothetical protein
LVRSDGVATCSDRVIVAVDHSGGGRFWRFGSSGTVGALHITVVITTTGIRINHTAATSIWRCGLRMIPAATGRGLRQATIEIGARPAGQ